MRRRRRAPCAYDARAFRKLRKGKRHRYGGRGIRPFSHTVCRRRAIRRRRRRALRSAFRTSEIHPRLRSGCGGILPRKASRRGRYNLPLPPPHGDSLRGYRTGISDGGGHCARVRRKRKGARTSRSAHSACKRGGNSGKCSEVKHGVLCAGRRG